MFRFLPPGIIKASTECLSNFPKREQNLLLVLMGAGIVLFFIAAAFAGNKKMGTFLVCFLLSFILMGTSMMMVFSSKCS